MNKIFTASLGASNVCRSDKHVYDAFISFEVAANGGGNNLFYLTAKKFLALSKKDLVGICLVGPLVAELAATFIGVTFFPLDVM